MDRESDLIRQQRVNILTLKRVKIFNEEGEQIYFSSLWEKSDVVVVFLRHFGCIACRARVNEISKFYNDMKEKEVNVVFIGSGQPEMITKFKSDLELPDAEIYTDPTLESFDACGMNRSLSNLVSFRSLTAMRVLRKKGYRQGETFNKDTGAQTQMGGVVAFKDPGKVLYHFTSKHLGDFDDPCEWPMKIK